MNVSDKIEELTELGYEVRCDIEEQYVILKVADGEMSIEKMIPVEIVEHSKIDILSQELDRMRIDVEAARNEVNR